jgi:hypothetical protein
MSSGIPADPDVAPGRRDRERTDAGECSLVAEDRPAGVAIAEAATRTAPRDAGLEVGRVAKPGGPRVSRFSMLAAIPVRNGRETRLLSAE